MINKQELKFYSYTGFSEPKLLADSFKELSKKLIVESNYLGDVTNDTLEEISELIENFDTIEDMQKYGEITLMAFGLIQRIKI
ncbi:hypothetical protein RT967_000121 [Staphylococcus pseudintermedius]|nr:hypothetical protein [Staphylococcus pseudintermedius]EGQ4408704.1 hypothetical protein [Staphylococcus pseudintermedius]ELJ9215762.1 hypothetical protein [Staphylococcus pseudintermedius]